MSEQDICGSTNTGTGEPCLNPPGCSIPAHNGMPDGGTNRGRPTKFDDERAQAAIAARKDKLPRHGCADAAGVSRKTFYSWLEDESLEFVDEDGTRRSFVEAWRRASAESHRQLIQEGLYDPNVDGQATRHLLGTSYGHTKTEKHELEHSGSGGGPLEIAVRREVVDVNDE